VSGPAALLQALKRGLKEGLRPVVRRYARHHGVRRPELPPSYWDLTHDPASGLRLDGLSLHELLAKWGSPLHVVHACKLARNVERFQQPLPGSGRRCEVYYSYKTNPVPGILRFLHDRNVGAEVISPYELWLAFRLGVPPQKIVYNGPAKSDASLRAAIERDILLININHREEIGRVARIATDLERRPSVGLRVVAPGGWAGQFGMSIASGEALRGYEEALATNALDVVALHAHFGAPIRSAGQLAAFVQSILAFCDRLHDRFGLDLDIVDFGGSLAIPSVAPVSATERRLNWRFHRPLVPPDVESALTIEGYTQQLLEQVEAHYRARGRQVPRVFVEPGRALTGNAQMLVASVVTTKEGGDGVTFAVMDAGINLAEGVQHEYHQLFPVNRFGQPASRVYTLTGPICSPGDVLYPAWELPALGPGDSVAIMDAGAYFVPFSTSFSFPRPAIVMVDGGQDVLLRSAERFGDLIAYDDLVAGDTSITLDELAAAEP
jgi:diaminopimelate decarboxylase